MFIELLGMSGAKIQSNDTTILLAPPSEQSELKASRFKADVVVLGNPKDEVNIAPNQENEAIFTIASPGEYESRGVFFYCLANPAQGETVSLLTSATIEGVVVTHLGGLNRALTATELELFDGTDVLILPAGGNGVLGPKEASDIINQLEPRVVIPMHTARPGLKTKYRDVADFLKEIGSKAAPQEKIKITKKDLPQEDMQIINLL